MEWWVWITWWFLYVKIISSTSQKNEELPNNPPIHIYINWINNRLVLKIKDGYKLELQMSESMKSFDSAIVKGIN